ncbi:MAG TPA: cation:proton antiporter [Erysipelothrix sp.]|nr:cation:proton antiporter [Erysipelothrix sp.]
MLFIRLVIAGIMAFLGGKLVQKFKLPAILGWLVVGMIVGPHALGLLSETVMLASWYTVLMSVLEVGVGCLIGSELVIKQLKKSGKQIVITTLFQSLGTFLLVTLVFGIIFKVVGIPVYVALLFGGIALATAPAPALSIVQEFKTKGPVTDTLIPMAVLDDVVAILVFFTITSLISAQFTEQSTSLLLTLFNLVALPIIIGAALGYISSFILKVKRSSSNTMLIMLVLTLTVGFIGYGINTYVFAEPVLNYMLLGMAFSAVFANMIDEDVLGHIMSSFEPAMGIFLLLVILNLGAPLDYQLILGAGLFTAVYIIARACGKYFGARLGAKTTKLPDTVQKYLGLTLLPHSGVSLVFTGIAATTLQAFDPQSALVIQGTIAAAAIINEILAVIIAKKAFEWSGEMNQQ